MTPEEKAKFDAEQKSAAELLVKTVNDGVQPIKDELVSLKSKVEAIEKSPVLSAPAIITRASEYKGVKLSKTFQEQRDTMCKTATGDLKKEEHQDELAKMFIDVAHVAKARKAGGMDMEAIGSLKARQAEIIKTNALNDATSSEGGYTIQPDYQWDIIKMARNTSWALKLCRVVNMPSLVSYFPTEASIATTTWQAEGVAMTPNEPTFGQLKLTANKAMTLARVTNEQLADNMVDLPGLLLEQFAYSIAQELDNQVFNGTGSPWSGILTAQITQSVVLAAGASFSTLTFTDLSLAISKLYEARLEGAAFVSSRLAKHYIRALKDTYGRPIYAMPGNGVPGTVYEYPLFTSEKITNTDGASKVMAIFGNFNYAVLGRRQGLMNIDVDPYGMFDSDITRFRMVTRWGFGVGDVNAFTLLKSAAA